MVPLRSPPSTAPSPSPISPPPPTPTPPTSPAAHDPLQPTLTPLPAPPPSPHCPTLGPPRFTCPPPPAQLALPFPSMTCSDDTFGRGVWGWGRGGDEPARGLNWQFGGVARAGERECWERVPDPVLAEPPPPLQRPASWSSLRSNEMSCKPKASSPYLLGSFDCGEFVLSRIISAFE